MEFEEFRRLAAEFTVIPVARTMIADTLTPVSAYMRLRRRDACSFLLESVEGGEHIARYSFIGCGARTILRCRGTTTTIIRDGTRLESTESLFDIVGELVGRFHHPTLPSLPRFTGGLVGFIGYDSVRFIERIPDSSSSPIDLDDSVLALFTTIVAFDHLKHQVTIIANATADGDAGLRERYDAAVSEIGEIESLLFGTDPPRGAFHADADGLVPSMPRERYECIVRDAKRHIEEGDIFQVVLSQRFSVGFEGDPFHVYRALRVINPSPYLYYLDLDGVRVIGSSPEILVRMEGGIAEVYPIAGTRPRGTSDGEDMLLERELLADEKERAEHIMLIDLARNDLGRVSSTGSVAVDQFMAIVRYSHVMHIASRVTGRVAPGKSAIDVLKATFPAGTVSGAPKIRAMEIIDALEKNRRGLYAGGVGYFAFSGAMDFCIAIRTMIATDGTIRFQAGAGIVADSDPAREYGETLNKAQALVEALRMAGRISR